jgi:transcription elongation GreA/GreB family factor
VNLDKRLVIELIVAQISRDLATLVASAKASHTEATHEQNKAENKYDTRALEASYLAHGQSRKIAECEAAKQEFESLTLLAFPPHGAIDLGALVTLGNDRDEDFYFIGPKAGGTEIIHDGAHITVITPTSPLGQQLMGKRKNDSVALPGRKLSILQVT